MLSIVSRRRWPEGADLAPAIGVPPPKKKKAAAVKAEPAADAKADEAKAAEAKAEPASEPKKD
ncbi:MAG: hypothetical protein ACI89G_002845 [Minisyncoccia bacterium]